VIHSELPGRTSIRLDACSATMHNACMVALQIRGVSEEVRGALAIQARARGQSLQGFLLELLEVQAARQGNVALLARFAGRVDGVWSRPGETATEIALDRAHRETMIDGGVSADRP
jgi:antitoxin FitA